jgi:hypothetical protein
VSALDSEAAEYGEAENHTYERCDVSMSRRVGREDRTESAAESAVAGFTMTRRADGGRAGR